VPEQKLKKFKLMCTWTLFQEVEVEATDLDEALDKAHNEMDLPSDGEYLSDSFQADQVQEI